MVAATVYHNELHIFGGYSNSGGSSQQSNKHYKWDESSDTWAFVDTMPFNVDDGGSALVFEDEIFIFEHESSTNYCYKWNEVDGWTQFELPTSYDHTVRRAIEHNDAIYIYLVLETFYTNTTERDGQKYNWSITSKIQNHL